MVRTEAWDALEESWDELEERMEEAFERLDDMDIQLARSGLILDREALREWHTASGAVAMCSRDAINTALRNRGS